MKALRLTKRGVDVGDQEELLCWLITTFLVATIFTVFIRVTAPVGRNTLAVTTSEVTGLARRSWASGLSAR